MVAAPIAPTASTADHAPNSLLLFPVLTVACALAWAWRLRTADLISERAALLHVVFAVLFLLLSDGARRWVGERRPRWCRPTWQVLAAAVLLMFNLAAFANTMSRSLWGDPLSALQAWDFLRYERVIGEALRQQLSFRSLALVVLGLVISWLTFRGYRRLAAASIWLRLAVPLRFLVLVGLLAVIVIAGFITWRDPVAAREEPLIAFLTGGGDLTNVNGPDSRRKLAAELDRRVLASYAADLPRELRPRTNVILILADSLRADHLPFYGYSRQTAPFLSEMVARGGMLVVPDAFSTCSESFCGIASTLTGRPFHSLSAESLKIYELLALAGYSNQMILGGDHQRFANIGAFYGPQANVTLRPAVSRLARQTDDRMAVTFVAELAPAKAEPVFMYFFLMSPHVLAKRLGGFAGFLPADSTAVHSPWNSRDLRSLLAAAGQPPSYLEQIINDYDNRLLQVDWVLRKIFEGLAAKRYLDDAIVIVVGDHGESLGEHNRLGHTFHLYDHDIRVPLLIWDSRPGAQLGAIGHASQVDIVPTILDRLDLPIPATLAGGSLWQSRDENISVHATRRGREPCGAAIHSRGRTLIKLLACRRGGEVVEELFDLRADPDEAHNLLEPAAAPLAVDQAALLPDLRRRLPGVYGELVNSCETFDCIDPDQPP